MSSSACLSIGGLFSGFLGSIILAFSLNSVLRELILAANWADLTLESLLQTAPVVKATGLDKRLDRGALKSKRWSVFGAVLLVVSFALQFAAVWKAR